MLAELTAGDEGVAAPLAVRLCGASVRVLGVTGATLALGGDGGVWATLGASDDVAGRLGELEFTLGEGPVLDAYQEGRAVLEPDLDGATGRWPGFGDAAARMGIGAVFAFPLRIGVIRLGALGMYRTEPGPLGARALGDALVLADLATQVILVGSSTGELDGRLVDERALRAEVHQATGMLAAQGGIGMEEAFVRLRAHAFATGRRVGEVAGDVVARRLRLSDL